MSPISPAILPAAGTVRRPAPTRAPGWGWIEWTVVLQVILMGLLFIPPLAHFRPARTALRAAPYALLFLAWAVVSLSPQRAAGRGFPARIWLSGCAIWLGLLLLLHPWTNSLFAGLGEIGMIMAVAASAFWAPAALKSLRQVHRLMIILLALNMVGTLLGIAQFFRPDTFDPPVIPLLQARESLREEASITTSDGRKVLRPCGLTDIPGGASSAGGLACVLGLAWALRPIPVWKRLVCLGCSGAGMAVIYFCQVRAVLVATVGTIAVLAAVFALRFDFRKATALAIGGSAIFAAALVWVVATGGEGVTRRFATLLEDKPTNVYNSNRGVFLRETFEVYMVNFPLGAGLGRWGQAYDYFGDRTAPIERGPLWAEIQLTGWVIGGGIPLFLGYMGAILAALASTLRIALKGTDPEIADWAAVVFALNIGTVAGCLAGPMFMGAGGMQFWLLSAVIHGANERARLARAAGARWA